jgi:predicted ATP-dependent endonuclease of OLD family
MESERYRPIVRLLEMEVENFKSLEKVRYEGFQDFNVFIGRNNAGKSTTLDGLEVLAQTVRNQVPSNFVWAEVMTHRESTRQLAFALTFTTSESERGELYRQCALDDSRRFALEKTPFARLIRYEFRAPTAQPALLHLRRTSLKTEDGGWGVVQQLANPNEEASSNPESQLVELERAFREQALLSTDYLRVAGGRPMVSFRFQPMLAAAYGQYTGATFWPIRAVVDYLGACFFFDPFRHSAPRLAVEEQASLNQDGSNLVQVIHTLRANDPRRFTRLEEFVHEAIPGLGLLATPLHQRETEIAFGADGREYTVSLPNMGGGIEQLLMIGTFLVTKGPEATLFVEEPETHLHPSAQRFLAEQMARSGRQVFITTHSPLMLNVTATRSIYRLQLAGGATHAHRVTAANELARTLDDIGVRNSDVLLSDAVMFVEGNSDRDALVAVSRTLGRGLAEDGVTVVAMGGGRLDLPAARVRSEVLEQLSQRSPIPHLIVLDRDERTAKALEDLSGALGDRLFVLGVREMENYLLVPRAIRQALLAKYRDNDAVRSRVEALTEQQIQHRVKGLAEELRFLTLLKRVKARIGRLPDGAVPSAELVELAKAGSHDTIAKDLVKIAKATVGGVWTAEALEVAVAEENEMLNAEWADETKRARLVPGADVLERLFREVGGEFNKRTDTPRIAVELAADEIDPELKVLIDRARRLPPRDA